jgi:hypothetical protein
VGPRGICFKGLIIFAPKEITEGIINDVSPSLQALPKGGLPIFSRPSGGTIEYGSLYGPIRLSRRSRRGVVQLPAIEAPT